MKTSSVWITRALKFNLRLNLSITRPVTMPLFKYLVNFRRKKNAIVIKHFNTYVNPLFLRKKKNSTNTSPKYWQAKYPCGFKLKRVTKISTKILQKYRNQTIDGYNFIDLSYFSDKITDLLLVFNKHNIECWTNFFLSSGLATIYTPFKKLHNPTHYRAVSIPYHLIFDHRFPVFLTNFLCVFTNLWRFSRMNNIGLWSVCKNFSCANQQSIYDYILPQ